MIRQTLTYHQVLSELLNLKVEYEVGTEASVSGTEYSFASLRSPHPEGLYFLEGDAVGAAKNSLYIYEKGVSPVVPDGSVSIAVEHPQVTYYRLMQKCVDKGAVEVGVHPSAVVDAEAVIGVDVYVGPFCIIGKAEISDGVRMNSHVVVNDGVTVGRDTEIESHTVLGATGVAWVWDPSSGERIRQPQIGSVAIGSNCFIGTDVTVVRGSLSEVTSIGNNTLISHGTKIGHGCVIGDGVHCANNVTMAGNVDVGDKAFLGAGCTFTPQVSVASRVVVGAGAVVTKTVAGVASVVAGVPAKVVSEGKSPKKMAGVPSGQ